LSLEIFVASFDPTRLADANFLVFDNTSPSLFAPPASQYYTMSTVSTKRAGLGKKGGKAILSVS
jgi:hypothetical protein